MQESTHETQGRDEVQLLFFLGRDYRVAANLVYRKSSLPRDPRIPKPEHLTSQGERLG